MIILLLFAYASFTIRLANTSNLYIFEALNSMSILLQCFKVVSHREFAEIVALPHPVLCCLDVYTSLSRLLNVAGS
jgi:hypothetical protein